MKCYEELLEGHAEVVVYQCLQAASAGTLKSYCQIV